MNPKVKIEELGLTESGVLTGGFGLLNGPGETDALVNRNCSNTGGFIYNDNCGCNACGSSTTKTKS